MAKNEKIRLGIIGMGNMGKSHARKILDGNTPRVSLAAVCDRDPAKLEGFGDASKFTDADAMFASGDIDSVLIATPHYSHTTLGAASLKAGIHTLVEKPISVHKADCERLIAAHTDKKVVFAAMFNQRTNPTYVKVRELLQNNTLGKLQRITWVITNWFRSEHYYASGDWRATWGGEGGGVLLNQCPHQLDLWQWFFGMPDTIHAFCQIGRWHDIEVEDDVTAYMQYKNGPTGVFITTTGEAPGTNCLEIAGEHGKLIVEKSKISFIRNEVSALQFSKTTQTSFGAPPVWNIEIPVAGDDPQHVGIMNNFADAILDGTPLIAPAAEGVHSVELANAMLYSTFTDSTVSIPLDAAAYEGELKKKIESSTYVKKTVEAGKPEDMGSSF